MKTKDLLKTKLSSLAGPPLRQPRPLDERLRPARRQPDDHDDRDGRQSGIRLRRPQATVETFTQVPDYTVTFQADGATVKTMTVEDGYVLKDSDYPAVPTKTGYTGEWVKYTSAVHSNVTVQAKYTAVVTKYTVTFKADNTVVKTMTVKDGYTLKASDYPTVPAKSGYTGEWVKYTAAIHSDITINAVYEPSTVIKQYTVVFRADAKVLKTMKVEVGYTLQDSDYPEIPAKEGYTGHWDKSTTRIIKNTIINVIYSDNSSHVVTFIFDGAQIGTLTVTDGYVLKNSDYPSPFAPVGYIVTWEKYTLPIHSDITVTGKLQSDVTIPPQPTSPGEIMSGGEGEPVEADVPAEDETVSPQGTHVTGTQTVTHEYLTLNGKVARETIKTNNSLTAVLDFVYDESGKPFALKYSTNGTSFQTYYYVLNLQGDVVKLIHYIPGFEYESVATYEYDAWGNIVSSSGRLAEINPLRYRGYYYDNETGFYYLQSRYYDPVNRRFINADSLASTGQGSLGTNMFAYCNNEPVQRFDPTGHSLRPTTTAICDGGTGVFRVVTDGDTCPESDELMNYLLNSQIPRGSPYVDASIQHVGERFWDNQSAKKNDAARLITLVAAMMPEIAPYVAAGLFASDIYDDYLGPLTHPIDGYHETWIVNVDVYIDTGEERYLERREYVYMLARNSPTGAFWYQCSASYSRVYGDG